MGNSRPLKFRAWDKKNRKMYDNVQDGIMIDENYGLHFGVICNNQHDHYDFVVLQYTGLKDKNGREIYEGDIVRTLLHHAEVCHGWFKENVKESEIQTLYGWFIQDGNWQFNLNGHLEVVGNIYENPELINKEK